MILSFRFGLVAAWAVLVTAQKSGWAPNQVNATICQWRQPRAGIIRDTLYLDGGYLFWQPGFQDGTYGSATQDGNPLGLVYTLNFSIPFNTSMNTSDIFSSMSKAPNGGAVNNIAPNYYDGAMFVNDNEWYTYGGVLLESDELSAPDEDAVLGYQAYWYGAADKKFTPGFVNGKLPAGITRYVTAGAEVSVPSENLAFYFGGLTANNSGPIFGTPASINETHNADVLSTSFITFNMEKQEQEVWTNNTLPTNVPGRVNAELVWVPVGQRGVLIAIGGVVDPVFANANMTLTSNQSAANTAQSSNFMTTVAVYDIESRQWYMQPTNSGSPPPLTQGCAVVASSSDYTSHNIYWYGGFDGINPSKTFNDDVWILSIPSFMWMRVLQGTNGHGRAGHKCVKPYPDQMMVIGGYTPTTGTRLTCVDGGIIQILNLSSTEWLSSYNPSKWAPFSIPPMIYNMIGGTALGGSNMLPPFWANQSMATLFGTSYNITKLTSYFPYGAKSVSITNPVESEPSGLPSFIAPLVGVIVGLVVISAIITAWILYKRKKYIRAQGDLTNSNDASRYKVLNWMRGAPEGISPTVSSEEPKGSFDDVESNYTKAPAPIEAASTQLFEMPDNSVMSEMGDTGLSYVPASALPSGRPNGLRSHPSNASRLSKVSRASDSDTNTPQNSPSRSTMDRTVSPLSKPSTPRPDSPALGGSTAAPRIASGVSTISGLETPPMRTSIGLVNPFTSDSETEGPPTPTPQPRKKSVAGIGNYISGPVSPPTPTREEEDYIFRPSKGKKAAEVPSLVEGTVVADGTTIVDGTDERMSSSLKGSPSKKARIMLGIEPKGLAPAKDNRRKSAFGEMLDD